TDRAAGRNDAARTARAAGRNDAARTARAAFRNDAARTDRAADRRDRSADAWPASTRAAGVSFACRSQPASHSRDAGGSVRACALSARTRTRIRRVHADVRHAEQHSVAGLVCVAFATLASRARLLGRTARTLLERQRPHEERE